MTFRGIQKKLGSFHLTQPTWLIGVPIKIIIGKKFVETKEVEIKLRKSGEAFLVKLEDVKSKVKSLLETLA